MTVPQRASMHVPQEDAERSERPGRSSVLLLILRLVIATGLLLWLFDRSGGLATVWNTMRTARGDLVVGAFGLTLAVQLLIAHRLRLIVAGQGVRFRTREVLAINLGTQFFGLFMPGGGFTAIAIRFYRLTRTDRRYTATLVAIVCDRLLATGTLCLVGVVLWWLDGPARSPAAFAVLSLSAVASVVAMLPMFAEGAARAIGGIAERLPFARGLWRRTSGALAAHRALPARTQAELAGLSLAAHVLAVCVYVLLARSLAIDIAAVALGWMRSVAGLVTMIPLSISGLGVREGTTTALLAGRGVPEATAFGFSLLVFGITVLGVGLVGGLVEVARWFLPARATTRAPGA
jgi:uncharacterized membrane protein YbhN (UPF0104 family)